MDPPPTPAPPPPPPAESSDDDRRRTLWLALISALLILAIAQADEHRRFRRAQEAYLAEIAKRTAQTSAYMDQINELLRQRAEGGGDAATTLPMLPAFQPEPLPPEPRPEKYRFVARVRQAVCFGAFAVAAAMPVAWVMSTPQYARRHRRFMAEVMLALALFGTIGMLLGWGHLANWNRFRIGTNAAGYGLVLVPLGAVAVMLASRADAAEDDDDGGGSKR